MWLYSGPDDPAQVHPEEVSSETVALWLRSITGNQDNPRGYRQVVPFSKVNPPDKVCFLFRLLPIHAPSALDVYRLSFDQFVLQVFAKMHPMPNGEQALEQTQEGEDSAEDSDEWDSQEDEEEEEESEESD